MCILVSLPFCLFITLYYMYNQDVTIQTVYGTMKKKKLLKIDKWKKATKFVVETFQVLKFK